jgi:hypothetical protein
MRISNGRRSFALAGASLLFLTSVLLADSPGKSKAPASDQGPLVVHEWGTFLSVQGSDGVTLGGIVDSEEPLPSFVEAHGIPAWQRSKIYLKMETPVTYFYVDRPRDVQVRVEMPQGTLTHWFPRVRHLGPNPLDNPVKLSEPSFLDWATVHLIPDRPHEAGEVRSPALPPVGPEQTWRFARETDSALVSVRTWDDQGVLQAGSGDERKRMNQTEKFLFYRGLGTFTLPLQVQTSETREAGLSVTLANREGRPLHSMFAVRIENGTIQFASLGDLSGATKETHSVRVLFTPPQPLDQGVAAAKDAVAASLVTAGLFPREARAMVNTWEKSYFRTEGFRLLYVLPRQTVDRMIPIQVKPAPDKLVRVMVGRVEVLTPAQERQIEKIVADLGADDFKLREAASSHLAQLGRLGEPALRRIMATSRDAEVRARAGQLIRRIAGK